VYALGYLGYVRAVVCRKNHIGGPQTSAQRIGIYVKEYKKETVMNMYE